MLNSNTSSKPRLKVSGLVTGLQLPIHCWELHKDNWGTSLNFRRRGIFESMLLPWKFCLELLKCSSLREWPNISFLTLKYYKFSYWISLEKKQNKWFPTFWCVVSSFLCWKSIWHKHQKEYCWLHHLESWKHRFHYVMQKINWSNFYYAVLLL